MKNIESSACVRPRFVNTAGLSELTGWSANKIRVLVFERRIPFRKLGRSLVFDTNEIFKFLEQLPGLPLDQVKN